MSTLIALMAMAAQPAVEPVELWRTFTKGESMRYEVASHLLLETRELGLQTFMPEELDLTYTFTKDVTDLTPDGMAVLRYRRPTMTIIEGETAESPPIRSVERPNLDMAITLSQINEFIEVRDNNPRPPATATTQQRRDLLHRYLVGAAQDSDGIPRLGQFIEDLQRLSLFVGSLDSAIDFSPRLPLEAVRPGDTWRSTVSYQPQRLAGASDRTAVQRLDYVFTYRGIVESRGARVHRVTAALTLDTNAADWFHQATGLRPSQTGLRSVHLKMDATIEFDLDLRTKRTLHATARSNGSVAIEVADLPGEPLMEQKLTGRTTMRLVNRT